MPHRAVTRHRRSIGMRPYRTRPADELVGSVARRPPITTIGPLTHGHQINRALHARCDIPFRRQHSHDATHCSTRNVMRFHPERDVPQASGGDQADHRVTVDRLTRNTPNSRKKQLAVSSPQTHGVCSEPEKLHCNQLKIDVMRRVGGEIQHPRGNTSRRRLQRFSASRLPRHPAREILLEVHHAQFPA